MIRNRLSELLSERGLKISRVAKDVKIARSSLTSMTQNDSEMIRYDAIDKLCSYLHISPSEFLNIIRSILTLLLMKNRIIKLMMFSRDLK